MISLCKLLRDREEGFVLSAELVLVSTIACLSLIVGFAGVQAGVTTQFTAMADVNDTVNSPDRYAQLTGRPSIASSQAGNTSAPDFGVP